jgi:hypothetical protein
MSLLDKALSVSTDKTRHGNFTPDEMELAIAWATGTITMTQAAGALGKPPASGTYTFMAQALKAAHSAGMWTVALPGKPGKQEKKA